MGSNAARPRVSSRIGGIAESATLAVDAKAKALTGHPVSMASGQDWFWWDVVDVPEVPPVTACLRTTRDVRP